MHNPDLSTARWSPARRILFRFFFCYFFLYILPWPAGWLPLTESWGDGYAALWLPLVQWTGDHVLHVGYTIEVLPNGSGDTTFNYVQVFLIAVISAIVALVWSLADRRRPHYATLLGWLFIVMRYYLAIVMLTYGFAKVIKSQFPFPYLGRLVQPYGESSPMGLLWTFMGYSTAYNVFTGLGEVVGGCLLFFRRTTALGALILVVVMSNVVVLNFAFDVPVKLFSLHLLLMTLLLLTPAIRALIDFFLFRRQAQLPPFAPQWTDRKAVVGGFVLKAIVILGVLGADIYQGLDAQRRWGDAAPKPLLYGIYDVELQVQKGDTLPAILNDTRRWRRMIVNWQNQASVDYMDDNRFYYQFSLDTLKHTLNMITYDSATRYNFSYSRPDSTHLALRGEVFGDSVHVLLRARSPNDFLLVNRGFNWVNEYPYNR